MMSAWTNMPHGERSCGNSAVLIAVSPGGDGAAGTGALALGALVLGAGAFAGPVSAPGAAVFAGGEGGAGAAGAASAGGAGIAAGGIDGLAAVVAGPATGGDGLGNGLAGVIPGACAAVAGRGAAACGRGRAGAGVLVCADAEWANATSGSTAASMANMQKRNGKGLIDADRATRRPPWLPHGSVFMSHPPKPPSTPTLQTANLSSK
jgi:hypothetical protein